MSKRKGFDSSLGSVLGSNKPKSVKKSTPSPPKPVSPEVVQEESAPVAEPTKSPEKQKARTQTEEKRNPPKRKVGRPKAEHNRIRFTSIVEQDLRDKMKIIAIRQGIKINDAFNNALGNYVRAWEKKNGNIEL